MTACLTIDVEDWYDGMAQLGHPVTSSRSCRGALASLIDLLASTPGAGAHRLTLFVVGMYAPEVADDLRYLADRGHEIASHGLDHGSLPQDPRRLETWLRQGREAVEEVVQRPVTGFRSPRFDVPSSMALEQYREVLAASGFRYVSDRHHVGPASPVRELPVLQWRGFPIGGGSYQRLFPAAAVTALIARLGGAPSVLYYHSYDFGETMPTLREDPSLPVLKYSLGRGRIPDLFRALLGSFGSVSCRQAADGV